MSKNDREWIIVTVLYAALIFGGLQSLHYATW